MTTLELIDLTCPVCTTEFRSQSVVATEGCGGKRTDFHEHVMGMQPLPFFMHMCTQCGYAGVMADFAEGVLIGTEVQERVWQELKPALERELPTGSLKYQHAALIAEWQGCEPRYLADLYLRAAWCCVEENDIEAERYFRRKAVSNFIEALTDFGSVPSEERAVLTYLIGELWRRIGDEYEAAHWFDRVMTEITNPAEQGWVLLTAYQQKTDPLEWFV